MNLRPHSTLNGITILLVLSLFQPVLGQWQKSETLTGGSIVSDMIEFNDEVYVALVSGGIFRSADAGDTWTRVPVSAQPNPVHFVISATNLLAISYGKTFSTSDGDQWSEGAGPEAFINDVAFEGGTHIFAATHNGIYQSADEGATWSRIDDSQTHGSMKSIAVQGNIVWAGADAPAAGNLLKSEDGGITWTTIDKGSLLIRDIVINGGDILLNISYDGIYRSSNQGADWQLVRNLSNSEGKLYAGASGLFYFSNYKLYTSANSGNTWSEKAQMIPFYNFNTLYATDDHIFVGLWGGGVARTTTTGDTGWQLVNNGIAAHDVNDLAVVGSTIYAGLENSFIRTSGDEGLTWTQQKDTYGLFAGSGRAVLSTGSELFVGSGGGGVQRSSDNGVTWVLKNEGLVSKNVLQFATAGNAIFVGTDDGVYKSINKGDSWAKKTGDIAMLRTVYSDGTKVYAGTYNGLFLSEDTGETWTRISAGLPDQSISGLVHIGGILYAATQFNGLYTTPNHGGSWEKVSSEYVLILAARNHVLFMSTLDDELLISSDSGRTAEDIAASLPPGRISTIAFTDKRILIGKSSAGLWTRKISEIVPPHLEMFSGIPDDKFLVGAPIFVESDQALHSPDGSLLSEAMDYITVTAEDGTPASFTSEIDAETSLITINITDAVDDEIYTVSIDPLYNESGLASHAISKEFTAVVNQVPSLTESSVQTNQGQVLVFSKDVFDASFMDPDGDPLIKLMVKGLPSHGTLKLEDVPVTVNQEIDAASIGQLSYTAESAFSGKEYWYWNGSDGINYSPSDVRMTIDIAPVTSVSPETSADVRVYPNPVSSTLTIESLLPHAIKVDIADVVGRHIRISHPQRTYDRSFAEIDFADLPPGIYFVRIQSETGLKWQQKVIKQ